MSAEVSRTILNRKQSGRMRACNQMKKERRDPMDISDIRVFLEITRLGSLSAAAHTLFSTQSTISRRLALLEKELGTGLFERGRGIDHVHLTPAGERFLPIAEQMAELERQALLLKDHGVSARLTIAVPDSIASYRLREYFAGVTGAHPEWDLEISLQDSLSICRMAADRKVDIGITNGEFAFAELKTRELFREDFLVLTRDDVLGSRGSVRPDELDVRDEVRELCGAEFDRWHSYWWKEGQARVTVNLAGFAVGMLKKERDWTILPESVARALCPPDGHLLKLSGQAPKRVCQFVTHRALRPGLEEITETLFREMQEACGA